MGWASRYIEHLLKGETVSFRPRGNSMVGKINSGQLCTLAPFGDQQLKVGDIVLCTVNGNQYLHLIIALKRGQYQIGNNRGGINGWITSAKIYGVLTHIE